MGVDVYSIALNTGIRTTWGEADLQFHEARRDMFLANSVANGIGYAMHSAGIDKLQSVPGATCLNDIFAP